jgi:radical SAM-linked protein
MGSTQSDEPKVRQRVRIRFSKQGDLRLIGHRDLARLMERLFRRAGLRLGMSEGFHPKPRMSFPSALAVGIEGLDEVMELELAEARAADELHATLSACAVPGLAFHAIDVLPEGPKKQKAQIESLTYQISIPAERQAETARLVAELWASRSCPVARPNRAPVDPREFLDGLTVADGVLSMRFRVTREASPGPRDLLAALGLADLERQGVRLRRTAVEAGP